MTEGRQRTTLDSIVQRSVWVYDPDLDDLHLVLSVGPDHQGAPSRVQAANVLRLDRREHASPRCDDEYKRFALDGLDPKQSGRGVLLERIRDAKQVQ